MKFGLIPELVGRAAGHGIPGYCWIEEALIRILTEPKNAIVKQYQKLFELDGVKLEFDRGCTDGDRRDITGEKDRCQRSACDHGEDHDGYDVYAFRRTIRSRNAGSRRIPCSAQKDRGIWRDGEERRSFLTSERIESGPGAGFVQGGCNGLRICARPAVSG